VRWILSGQDKDLMLPEFLIPESTIREAGAGLDVSLGNHQGGVLMLTLGITRTIEQESLEISVWGSADGTEWGAEPLISFPQKFYCGTYQNVLDLTGHPDVKHLRAKWRVNRWGKGESKPLFEFYLFVKELQHETLAMGA